LHFIGIAECPERLGLSRKEKNAKAKEIKSAHHGHVSESKRALNKNKKAIEPEKVAGEIMERKKSQVANLVRFPKQKIEHRTNGIAAAQEALEALDGTEATPPSYAEITAIREENRRNMTAKPLPDRPIVFGNLTNRAIWIADVMMGRQKGALVEEDDEIIRTLPKANPAAYRAAQDILNWKYEDEWEKYSEFRRAAGWPETRRPKG
jgi:hypothetical protein